MQNEVVSLDNADYSLIASMMGIETSGKTVAPMDTLTRLRIWNRPVMGSIEKSGKVRQMEVVPGGTYRFDYGEGKFHYCESIQLRPFLQRFRYSRWVPYPTPDKEGRKGKYVKSIFVTDYKKFNNTDLMDESGGFNCGRQSGYISNWKELPESTKKLITSVKRVRSIFGTVTLEGAMDSSGEIVSEEGTTVPVIWEIENNTAFKIMGQALSKYGDSNRLFPQHLIDLYTEGSPMTNGNMLYQPAFNIDFTKSIALKPEDNDYLSKFQSWVDNYNKYIKDSYDKNSGSKNNIDDEDKNIIDSFITVEEAV